MARPKRKRSQRPFRGPTPENVFQTVDVGTLGERRLLATAQKFPGRRYASVDPAYGGKTIYSGDLPHGAVQEFIKAGIHVSPKKVRDFIKEMKEKGWKTRHINFDMPTFTHLVGNRYLETYGFRTVFGEAPNILLPGGKIFVQTEGRGFALWLQALAAKYGLKARPLREIRLGPRTHLQFGGNPTTTLMREKGRFFVLEITLGLKKAIPSKRGRREMQPPTN